MDGTDTYYTETETRILTMLADGERHTKEELRTCLNDELACPQALTQHIMNMRRKLQKAGQDVVCEIRYRRSYYRRVIILKPQSAE